MTTTPKLDFQTKDALVWRWLEDEARWSGAIGARGFIGRTQAEAIAKANAEFARLAKAH